MQLSDLVGRIKTIQPGNVVKLGQYVDVFDNYNSWRNAKIISFKEDNISVSFDGWSTKYDEFHKVNSTRVAYFRSHTEPYTGAQKHAMRDFTFQKEVDHIQQVIQKMQELIIGNFRSLEASDMCQFVRGELYYLIDSILQETTPFINGDLKNSTDLMEAFIRFFIAWCKCAFEQMNTYVQGNGLHQFMYYFSVDVGIVACFPEMFDTMCKLLQNGQPRTKRYFVNNDQALLKLYNIPDKYQQSHVGFFNYFKQEKGLESFEQLMTWTQLEDNEIKSRVPFLLIKSALPLIEGIYRSLTANTRQEWQQKIKDIIFSRLHQLTPNDLKDNSTNPIFSILKLMPQHFTGILTINQECEQAEIKLAISLIKSNILEKKIKGVKELSDVIEKASRNDLMSVPSQSYYNEPKLQFIYNIMQEEKLFEILLNEAQHAEVFKRVATIMRFLAEQVKLKQSDIEQLWLAAQNRHEVEAKSIYEVISDISRVLQGEQLDYIYILISKIPQEQYDINLVNFIKDFTVNAQRNIMRNKPKSQNTLQLMWELLQDKSKVPTNLIGALMNGFIFSVRPERDQYLILCLDNIKKGISFPQSLQILQKIIESFGPGMLWNQNSSDDILNKVMKEQPMIDLIVRNLEQYRNSVPDVSDCQQVLQGKINHIQRIQYCMDFLEYVAANPKKFEFSIDNIKKLWTILVVNPIHESDRTPMLDFIIKGGFKCKEDLFKHIFCIFNYPVKQCYKSIEKYFYSVNNKNGSLNTHKNLVRVVKYDQITGLDFFFEAVFQRNDCEQAIYTLVQLHLRSEKISQVDLKIQMWSTFLNKCKEALKNQQNQQYQVSNIIKCIKELVTGIEGKQYLSGQCAATSNTKFTVQIGKDEKTQKELQLPSNTTLLGTRKYLNQIYNLKDQDYDLYLQNYDVKLQQESEEEYAIQVVEDSRLRDKPDIQISGLSQNMHPLAISVRKFKAMLSSNTEISEILFDLLQSENYEDIWEVLTIMPQNKQIKQMLERGGHDEDSWAKILHFNCNKKLLYCLQIYENMLTEQDVRKTFVKSKGLSSLIKYYLKRQENEFIINFNLKCFAQIAEIIYICGQSDNELGKKALQYSMICITKIENKIYQDPSSIQNFLTNNFKLVIQEPCNDYDKILKYGLIEFLDPSIRRTISCQLLELSKMHKYFFDWLMIDNSINVLQLKNQAEQYLEFFAGILEIYNPQTELLSLASKMSDIILKLVQEEDTDKLLASSFKLLAIIIKKCEGSKLLIQTNNELANAIINQCLFQLPTNNLAGARCQSPESRKAGYEIVQQLFANSNLMHIFNQYIQYAYWRTSSPQNWGIVQQIQNRSRSGYVGLKNLGCICYMNSLFQQLYTLPNFRDCILQLGLEPKPSSVLYQFQLLLSALKNSQKQYYDPRPLCNVLGPDGQPINVTEQMDVDEFYLNLMDKLEKELKPLQKDMIIKKNFGGLLSTEFISKQILSKGRRQADTESEQSSSNLCYHQSSRDELFLALSLQVKSKKNIYDSLKYMTEGEMLEGDNAYQCEKCDKRVPALMRVSVKQLPNVLILALKRFDYNYENFQKFKLNDFYEFPQHLNMKEFTQEYLKQQDMKDQEDGDQPIEITFQPEEYYEYDLRGVVIHVGTADSGHYYSLIKDSQTGQWNEFNDQQVKPFDLIELANEAFGNDEKTGKSMNIMNRAKNAYMVFYERKTYFDENGKALKTDNDLRWFFNNNSQQKERQNDEIMQDNIKFQISQIMFDESFFEFSYNLMKQATEYSISRYCLQYFLSVVVRFSERGQLLPKYLVELKRIVKSNINLAREFLNALKSRELLNELIIFNPIQDMRVIIVGLIGDAFKIVAETERKLSEKEFKEQSVLVGLGESLLYYLWEYRNIQKNFDQFHRILYLLSQVEQMKNCFRDIKSVGRILLFFLDEPPIGAGYRDLIEPSNEQNFMKLDHSFIGENKQLLDQGTYFRWECTTYDYTYLICTIQELIQQLDDDEVALLQDPALVKRLLQVTYTKMGRIALRDIFRQYIRLHCNQDPWTYSLMLVQMMYEFMKDCDERELKTALIVLRGIAELDDPYQEQRIVLVCEAYILSLKDNLTFWYYTSLLLDYILKICGNLKFMHAVQDILHNNKSVQKLIYNWIKESQNPYQNIIQQRWKLCRRRSASVQNQDLSDKLPKLQLLANKRLEQFEKILNLQVYESGYDSDQGIPEFKQGLSIDIIVPTRSYTNNYDNSNYQTWEIVQTLGDMLEIKNAQSQSLKWVHSTDSSIAPPNTQTQKYENHINFIKY